MVSSFGAIRKAIPYKTKTPIIASVYVLKKPSADTYTPFIKSSENIGIRKAKMPQNVPLFV